jgi:phage protein U
LSLGDFEFRVDTATYQELTRVESYSWSDLERLRRRPLSHFTGVGAETITLSGVIYPHSRKAGIARVNELRELGRQGVPYELVSGLGEVLGEWTIRSVEEKQPGPYLSDGTPLRQDFTVSLSRYVNE